MNNLAAMSETRVRDMERHRCVQRFREGKEDQREEGEPIEIEVKPVKVCRLPKADLPGEGLGEVGGAGAGEGQGSVVEINGRLRRQVYYHRWGDGVEEPNRIDGDNSVK
jgi:hypothetical protein